MYANCEIPIFTTPDPLAEKYYSISPYAYCGNNPLRYVDPTGMKIETTDESLLAYFGTYLITYLKLQQLEQNNINGQYDKRIMYLNRTLSAMNEMYNSENMYSFENISKTADIGNFTYDPKSEKFIISYFDLSNLVHEIAHAGQYEDGEVGFFLFKDENGNITVQGIVDINDEIEAYRAQYAFDTFFGVNNIDEINTNWLHNIRHSDGNSMYTPGGIANTSQTNIHAYSQFGILRLGKVPAINGVQSIIFGEHPADRIPLNQISNALFNKK